MVLLPFIRAAGARAAWRAIGLLRELTAISGPPVRERQVARRGEGDRPAGIHEYCLGGLL